MKNVVFSVSERFLKPKITSNLARFGVPGDGGYLISKEVISNSDILLSFGLGSDFSFEIEAKQLNPELKVMVWDHTVLPPSIFWLIKRILRGLGNLEIQMGKVALSRYIKYKRFFNKNNLHIFKKISTEVGSEKIENIGECLEFYKNTRILLKIDIEGDEYKILPSVLKYANAITGVIVEFHELAEKRVECYNLINQLQKTHEIEHLHINNYGGLNQQNLPNVIEVTFVKKGLVVFSGQRESLPTKLDSPNTLHLPDFHVVWD